MLAEAQPPEDRQSEETSQTGAFPPLWSWFRDRRVMVGTLIALAAVLLLGFFLLSGRRIEHTAIAFQWPESQRQQATLAIDDEEAQGVPLSGALLLPCRAGYHWVVAVRAGFEPYKLRVKVDPGTIMKIQPLWVKRQPLAKQDDSPSQPRPRSWNRSPIRQSCRVLS